MWCMVILGLLTIAYGAVTIRDGLKGGDVLISGYKGTKSVSAGSAIAIGIGATVLGVVELGVAYLWR